MYTGQARLEDGRVIEMTGTIMECANWCDNVIRENDGEITIDIRRMEDVF